uniref:BTB domain-containing protein n=1 Tax=Panagrellus redivivus TaxID=6233 RepID=A0A7E4V8E3_PANRE
MKEDSKTPATLTDALRNMCLSDEFSDVSFIIDDKDIPAHKVVLAARSTVFKTMLFGPQCSEEPRPRIKILDPVTTTAYFTDFLRLIYDQDVELNVNTAIGIYHLAQYYDVPAVLKTCTDYLIKKVAVDNALTIGEAVYLYEGKVWDHINWFIGQNAFETLGTPVLATLSARFIAKLLYCPLPLSETDVYKLFLPWIEARSDEAERQSVLKHISFPFMNPYELASLVYPKRILTDEQYHIALHASASYHWDEQTAFSVKTRCEVVWWRQIEGHHIVIDGDYRLCFTFEKKPKISKDSWKVDIPFPKRDLLVGKFKDTDWLNRHIYARPCPEGTLFEVRQDAPEDGVLIAKFQA